MSSSRNKDGEFKGPARRAAAIALHFDSLFKSLELFGSARTRPRGADPSYSRIMDRFLALADAHGFKLTIFVVGEELENTGVFDAVRSWSRRGHEIANHSYRHRHDLGALAGPELEAEVMRSHESIERCTGREPRGFASPAWNSSPGLLALLAREGYRYDASCFPSWAVAPLAWKVAARSSRAALSRGPGTGWLGERAPHILSDLPGGNQLVEFPLPTTALLRVPCYHTMSFVLGRALFARVLKETLASLRHFHYVMHPLDLFDPAEDFPGLAASEFRRLERSGVPLASKRLHAEAALQTIARDRDFVTMNELAGRIISTPTHPA